MEPGQARGETPSSEDKLYSGDGINKSVEISYEEVELESEFGPSPPRYHTAARHDFDRIAERHRQWV